MSYVHDLLAEVRAGCPIAAQEIADWVEYALEHPKSPVASVFRLVRRGGDARRGPRSVRDGIIRASVRRLPPAMPIEGKARAVGSDRELLAAIAETGLGMPKARRLRDIIETAIQ